MSLTASITERFSASKQVWGYRTMWSTITFQVHLQRHNGAIFWPLPLYYFIFLWCFANCSSDRPLLQFYLGQFNQLHYAFRARKFSFWAQLSCLNHKQPFIIFIELILPNQSLNRGSKWWSWIKSCFVFGNILLKQLWGCLIASD